MTRSRLHAWVLELCREAMVADPIAATEAIQALTGGPEVFCPEAYSPGQLHRVGAVFLRIARL